MKEMKLFLLSIEEAEKLPEKQRITKFKGMPCWWWLRSPGDYSGSAAYVGLDGCVYDYGSLVCNDGNGVRPALHLKSAIYDELPRKKNGSIFLGKDSVKREPIEWLLVEEENGVVTLLSKDCLILHSFNSELEKGNDFATSDLAEYMNTKLMKECFSEEEKTLILPVEFPDENNSDNKGKQGRGPIYVTQLPEWMQVLIAEHLRESGRSDEDIIRALNSKVTDLEDSFSNIGEKKHNIHLGTFTVDVELQENGKFDVYLAHEGSSGEHFKDVTAEKIGEYVTDNINSLIPFR